MGTTLMGGESSGTPLETRSGSQELAKIFQSSMAGNTGQLEAMLAPFQRLGAQSFASNFGYDPTQIGGVLEEMLADPGSATSGLFSSMEPFERQETQRQVGGMRNIFGAAGGRFSRNIASGEAELRGNLANQFGRARQEALLGANAQRGNTLASLMQFIGQQQQAQLAPLEMMMRYFQPGAPIQSEGLLPGLLGAAGNFMLARQMRRPGGGPTSVDPNSVGGQGGIIPQGQPVSSWPFNG